MYGTFLGGCGAVAMLALFQACGVSIAWALLGGESRGARLLLGSVLGSIGMQWLPALAAFPLGFTLGAHWVAMGLMAGAAGGVLAVARRRGRLLWPGRGQAGALLRSGAFLRHGSLWGVLAVWGFFCFLVLHSFRWEEGRVFSSQATFGDMPMHLSFITSLARQGTFPPHYSLLPGARLSYPFLSDSISASLYLTGCSLRLAYCLPMFLAGAQVLFGGWLLLRQLMSRRRRAGLAWVLFFFNGGLGLFWFLGGTPENFTRIFTAFYQTPTNLTDENIRWVNVIVDMMLPQRATLFGWAVLFPALYLLARAVFDGQAGHFPVVGLLAGALPMIHTHSFLALALVCGAWLTAQLWQGTGLASFATRLGKCLLPAGLGVMALLKAYLSARGKEDGPGLLVFAGAGLALWLGQVIMLLTGALGKDRPAACRLLKGWGLLLAVTCLLALPQLFAWTFRQVSAGGMVRGHFGWVTGPDNYLWFYLKNLGLTAPLALWGLLAAKQETFARYCPALAIWFVAEFVEFQPNDYDNNKLLYVGFLFLCCAAADALCQLVSFIRHRKAQACAAVCSVALLSAPALLTMGRETVASYELFGQGALEMCRYIEENLPPDAVILTDQRHNNEVVSLTGRNIVCGSPAYLYYHGLVYLPSQQAAQALYEDPAGHLSLLQGYGVDYVLLSDFEQASYATGPQAFDALGFPRAYDDGSRILYQVKLPPRKAGNP